VARELGKVVGLWLLAGILIGVIAVLGTVEVNSLTSSADFCGNSCHSMQTYVESQPEFRTSSHQTSSTGIHAECRDCHLPRGFFRETWAHISSGSKDIYSTLTNDFTDPAVWEAIRPGLAHKVRADMLANDSENCRYCHADGKLWPKRERGQRQHVLAANQGVSCIGCHFDLVHSPVPPTDEFLEATRLQDDH
jgi:nitrate/TMAO reductase-like tetraheme cytochrome c subunit